MQITSWLYLPCAANRSAELKCTIQGWSCVEQVAIVPAQPTRSPLEQALAAALASSTSHAAAAAAASPLPVTTGAAAAPHFFCGLPASSSAESQTHLAGVAGSCVAKIYRCRTQACFLKHRERLVMQCMCKAGTAASWWCTVQCCSLL